MNTPKGLNRFVDFIFPPGCHLCGSPLPSGKDYLCPVCVSRLPRTLYHRIPMNGMEQRFAGIFPFERATGHFFYSSKSDISLLMQDLKYRRFRGLARYLGELVAKELSMTPFFTDIDAIIPVPMHYIKKAKRGYNQTEEIAKGIYNITGIPVNTNLKAIRSHRTQTSLTLNQRLTNTSGLFRLTNPTQITPLHPLNSEDYDSLKKDKNSPLNADPQDLINAGKHSILNADLKDSINANEHSLLNADFKDSINADKQYPHILLLDDVCTTGSTLISAAEAIHTAAPFLRISILTLGVTF